MPFEFPTEQRVLTQEEYAALGYIVRGETPKLDPGKPLTTGYSFPAYRAETKEEYAIDLAIGLAKVGYAISTGGIGPAVNTTLGYTWSLLT
jgi:hypothetical protein